MGIVAGIVAAVSDFLVATVGIDAGIAGFLAPAVVGAGVGAVGGGALDAIEGKPILPGLAEGALVGGAVGGLGPAIGSATGLGTTAGDIAAGAGAGALGGAVIPGTGGPLQGALGGAASGLAAGVISDVSGAVGGDLSASGFSEGLTPATGGTPGGPIDAGTFDSGGVAPTGGVTGDISASPAANAAALGAPPTAPGPGALAFTPPTPAAASAIDLTAAGPGLGTELSPGDASAFTAAQANVPAGTAALGADVATPGTPSGPFVDTTTTLDPNAQGGGVPGATAPGAVGGNTGIVDSGTWDTPAKGGVGNWFGKEFDKIGTFASDHPLQAAGIGLSTLGLGRSLLTANTPNPIPGQAQLAQIASELGQNASLIAPNAAAATNLAGHATDQAKTLENYLNTGTLPPALQASLDRATQSAITNIKAKYAAKGMPPDSSAEQQDIASVEQSSVINGGSLAASLFSQGVTLDQLASQIYGQLVGAGTNAASAAAGATESGVATNLALNTGVNNAISNLASALGGGSHVIVNGQTVAVPSSVAA